MAGGGSRTIRIRFDGSAAGLVESAAEASVALKALGDEGSRSSGRLSSSLGKLESAGNVFTSLGRKMVIAESALSAFNAARPAVVAMSGAFGLLPGVIGIAGAALATLKLGADGISKAFAGVATAAQKSVSAAFEKDLTPAAKNVHAILGAITPDLTGVAGAMSGVAVQTTGVVRSSSGLASLHTIFAATGTAVTNVGAAVAPLTDAFLKLAAVAAPKVAALTKGIGGWAQGVDDAASRIAGNGQFSKWIDTGVAKVKSFATTVVKDVGQVATALGGLGKVKLTIFTSLAPAIIPILTAISNFVSAAPGFAIGLLAVGAALRVITPLAKAYVVIQEALDLAMDANPIGLIVVAIAALVAAFVILWNSSSGFRDFWISIWHDIQSITGTVVNWITGRWGDFTSWLGNTTSSIGGWLRGAWNGVTGAVGSVVDWITGKWDSFTSFISGVTSRIGGFFRGLWSGLGDGLESALNWVIDRINGAINGINHVTGAVGIPGIPDIPHLAKGGALAAGRLALVGEQGPELVRFGSASRVFPASQTAQAFGGGTALSALSGTGASSTAAALAAALGDAGLGNAANTPAVNVQLPDGDLVLQLDGDTIARIARAEVIASNKRTVRSARQQGWRAS